MSEIIRSNLNDLPSFYAVELPCLIRNENIALECIGGKSSANEFLKHDTSIIFRFPGDNPLRTSLEGNVVTNPRILLKLKRKKNRKTGQIVSQSTELLGTIKKTVVFPYPADYQFLPSSTRLVDYVSEMNNKDSKVPFELVPESISRVEHKKRQNQVLGFLTDHKLVYRAVSGDGVENDDENLDEDNAEKNDEVNLEQEQDEVVKGSAVAEEQLEEDAATKEIDVDDEQGQKEAPTSANTNKRKPKDNNQDNEIFAVIIKAGDPIPTAHPLGEYPPRWATYAKTFSGFQLLERLHTIFKTFPGNKVHQFKEVLLFAAYTFAGGPFQHLWIRYGYDPTTDPTSRIYQQFMCKFTPTFLKTINDSLSNFLGKNQAIRKSVSLDKKVLTDFPSEFSHSFIDKGSAARIPVELFGYLLKQQTTFEICRCSLEETFEFMKKVSVMSTFHPHTGWYSAQSLDALRSYAVELITKLTKEFTQLTDVRYQPGPPNVYDKEHFERVWPKVEEFMNNPNPDFSNMMIYPDIPQTLLWQRRYQIYAQNNMEMVERRYPSSQPIPRSIPAMSSSTSNEHSTQQIAPSLQQKQGGRASIKQTPSVQIEEAKAFQFFNDSDSEDSD